MPDPKFKFRLETLLEHRRSIEKDCQRKVAEIQQESQKLLRQIQDAQSRIETENNALTRDKLLGPLDMQYIAHEKRFVGNLNMHIALTMRQLVLVEQKLAAARSELLAAAKAKKVIEKLREKQQTRWQTELNRKEAAAMDEMGTQIALREQTNAN
ncbi:MAG: flagellar export protein FliJ [Phycisphaerales bacterium]|nr:flagellar export protein FliJ [Phycisphaerales bacterium]